MASSFSPSGNESDNQRRSIPKVLLVCLVVGLILIIAAVGVSLKRSHTGTALGTAGQPADQVTGPHLGSEGNANGTTVAPDASLQTMGTGPGAMGSGTGSPGGH